MAKHPPNKYGFSLIEAILAMTILGIAAAGIMTSFSAALIAGKIAEDYAAADMLTSMLHAQLRSDMLDPLTVNSGTFTDFPEFSWQVDFTATTIENLYQTTLVVRWQRGQKTYEVQHVTYHYQPIAIPAV